MRRLVRFAGALALTSVAAAGATLLVRGEIIRRFGSEANGYYQVAWQVGQNYLGILGTSLWTYGMPKVASKLDDAGAVVSLQNDFLRIALAVLAPGIVVLLCTRGLWVPVLYTGAFLAAGPMLSWQLSGELLAMLRQSMNISLLPRERLGFLVFQAMFYWGGWALLVGAAAAAPGRDRRGRRLLRGERDALVVTYVYHRGRARLPGACRQRAASRGDAARVRPRGAAGERRRSRGSRAVCRSLVVAPDARGTAASTSTRSPSCGDGRFPAGAPEGYEAGPCR